MATRKTTKKVKAQPAPAEVPTSIPSKNDAPSIDPVTMADELLKDIGGKTAAIKKAIQTLDQEQARLEQSINARRKEIEKQKGRLNAYLVRLGGSAVGESSPKSNGHSNGKPARLTPGQTQELEVKVLNLATERRDAGLKRAEVVEALGVTAAQASRILAGLEQADRLNAVGERAGRRYFARG